MDQSLNAFNNARNVRIDRSTILLINNAPGGWIQFSIDNEHSPLHRQHAVARSAPSNRRVDKAKLTRVSAWLRDQIERSGSNDTETMSEIWSTSVTITTVEEEREAVIAPSIVISEDGQSFYTAEESVFMDWQVWNVWDDIINGIDDWQIWFNCRQIALTTEPEYEANFGSAAMTDDNREMAKVQQQEKEFEEGADRQEKEQVLHQSLQRMELNQQSTHWPVIENNDWAQLPFANLTQGIDGAGPHARQTPRGLHHGTHEQESQRQHDMIKKVQSKVYQDVAKVRANRVGLLSRLLNHDPIPHQGNIRPPSQQRAFEPGSYRTSGWFQEINAQKATTPPTGMDFPTQGPSASSRQSDSPRPGLLSPTMAAPMPLTKSAAAIPVSSVIQVSSVGTVATSIISSDAVATGNANRTIAGNYHLQSIPEDEEKEDNTDSEDNWAIGAPKSVVEQLLKDLATKQGIRSPQAPQQLVRTSKQLTDDGIPEWARAAQLPYKQQPPLTRSVPAANSILPTLRTAPIPIGLPHNLPPPAPPTTPRTTRRQMLSTELSESLRRNLLWEREITKCGTTGLKRTTSAGGSRRISVNGLPSFMPRVVQLHDKGTIPPGHQKGSGVLVTELEREDMRRHTMARNRG